MKLQVALIFFCLMAMAAAYTVLTGCGCHFGGCICADDGPVTLGIPGRSGRSADADGLRTLRSLYPIDEAP